MKLKKNKFIIGLSTTVLGSALAAGSQVAYADETVDIPADSTPGVSETSYDDFTKEEDGSYLGGDEKLVETPSENNPQAESVDEANSDTPAEDISSTEGKEQTSSDANDAVPANKTEENPTSVTEEDSSAKEEAGAELPSDSEPTSSNEEAVLTEPETNDKESGEAEPVAKSDETLDANETGVSQEDKETTDTASTEAETVADTVDEASTEKAQASEENAEDINKKETADVANTELKDDAKTSADSPQETPAGDEPEKDPEAGYTQLDKDGVSKIEEGTEPPETAEGAELPTEEDTEGINNKETADAANTELGDDAKTTADSPQATPAGDEPEKDPEAGHVPLTEEGAELPLVEEGAQIAPGETVKESEQNIGSYKEEGDVLTKKVVSAGSRDSDKTYFELSIKLDTSKRVIDELYIQDQFPTSDVDLGSIRFKEVGEQTEEYGAVTLKPVNATITINPERRGQYQSLLYDFDKATLEEINEKKGETIISITGNYKTEKQLNEENTVFNNSNFQLEHAVVRYPNENKDGEIIEINESSINKDKIRAIPVTKENTQRGIVDGVYDTNITINNIDQGDEDRITGRVYTKDGEELDDVKVFYDGTSVKLKLPEGVVKKLPADAENKLPERLGKNEDSVFNGDLKGYEDLEVELFIRPRTDEEVKDAYQGYVESLSTPNDTKDITNLIANEKGTDTKEDNVTVNTYDRVRYDNFNTLGRFEISLDDESNYDIITKDNKGNVVTDRMLKITAGVDKEIQQIDKPNSDAPNKYETAKENKLAVAILEQEYKNYLTPVKGEVGKYRTNDNWLVEVDPENPENIKVTTPIGAKKGENLTIPVTYLFSNGSEKNFLMNFAVTEESLEKPDYNIADTKAGQAVTNTPTNKYTEVKPAPVKYELESTSITDDKGKTWKLSINEDTGVVTATAPGVIDDEGSTINVPVIATYIDQKLKDKDGKDLVYTKRSSATFTATAPQEGTVRFTQENTIDFETIVRNNPEKDPTESGIVQKGQNGKYTADYTVTYEDGEVVEGPTIIEGSERDRVEPTDQIFEVGTKGTSVDVTAPDEQIIKIPYTTEITYDENQPVGYRKETPGEDGEKKITYEIVQQNGSATVNAIETTTKEATPRKIIIGTKPSELGVDFNPEIDVKVDNTKDVGSVDTEVVQGEYKTVTKNVQNPDGSIVTIEEVVEITKPKQIITVGTKDYTGDVTHTTTEEIPFDADFVENPELEAGTTRVTREGVAGSKEVTYTIPVRNGELDTTDGKKITSTSKETTAPINEVIEVGTKPVEKVVEIPFNTEYIYDDTLAAGTTKTDKEGVVGYKKLVTTYDEANKTSVTTVADEKAAENKIVRIGVNITSEKPQDKTIEIPFDTKIVYDETKPLGYSNIDTEGKNGSVTITFSEEIKDGKVTVTANEDRKEPTTQVVTIGTKAIQNVNGEKEEAIKPVVNVVYDPELEQGKIETEVEDGKAKASSDGSYNGDTGEIDNNTDVEVTQPTITVTVGTKPINKTKTEEIPFETEYVFDPDLEVGQQETQTEGQNGSRTITFERTSDGTTITEKEIDVKVTEPTNKVVRVGTKQTVTTQEIETPYETVIEYDNTKPVGDKEVTQKGTPGKKTVTVTTAIDKDGNVVSSTKENILSEATAEKVIIGTKVTNGNGETTTKVIEIPFETEITTDDNLAKGERVVDQKGEKGERTITVTTPVTNGVAGDPIVTDKVTKEAVKEIIRIGTKCPDPPKVDDKTVETNTTVPVQYETEIIYDNTISAGKVIEEQKGVMGERTVTSTVLITNGVAGQPQITSKITKEPVKQIIRIGTKKTTNSDNNTKPSKPTPPVSPTTQTITREIPYDTVFIYDNTIEAGKKVVTSPGQKGEKIVTVTSRVVNGKIVTETTEEVTKQPKTEYVRVGTKAPKYSGDDVVTNESKVLIPFETEIIYDDTLPLGQTEVVSEGRDGIQVVTITTRYQNGLVVDTTTDGYVEREAINKVVRVGTKTDVHAPTIDENTGIIDIPTTTEDNDHIIVIPEGAIDDENHVVVIPEETENDEDDASKKNRPVDDDQVVKGTKNIKVSEDDANVVNIKRSAVSSTNPKTGITGTAGIVSTLGISLAGITASRKKKENDEE